MLPSCRWGREGGGGEGRSIFSISKRLKRARIYPRTDQFPRIDDVDNASLLEMRFSRGAKRRKIFGHADPSKFWNSARVSSSPVPRIFPKFRESEFVFRGDTIREHFQFVDSGVSSKYLRVARFQESEFHLILLLLIRGTFYPPKSNWKS